VVDWAQTRYIIKHPEERHELNSLLGSYPSAVRVNNYFVASIAGHAVVSYLLPPNWRRGWQYVWIGINAEVIHRNRSVGVKIDF
jgi:hypothetical protein